MTAGELKVGDPLELSTAAFFQAHGYLVRRGVKLSSAAGEKDTTDVDLVAIRFHVPVREERIIVDCRDRKRSVPFERVLWTLGLSAFTRAHHTIVVTPKPIPPVREFAAQGGVEVLSAEQVAAFVVQQSTQYYGDADTARAARLARVSHLKLPETKSLLHELARVRQMLVVGSPTTNFNRLVLTIRRLRGLRQGSSVEWPWLRDFVCNDATVTAALMLLRFVEEVKWSPEADWRTTLTRRLTYGDVPPSKALQLAKIALDQPFPEGLPPPEYTEEVGGLVDQLIARSAVSVWTPISVDYLLAAGTVRSSGVPWVPAELQAEVLALGRRVISTIGYAVTGTAGARGQALQAAGEVTGTPIPPSPQSGGAGNEQVLNPKSDSLGGHQQ